MGIKTNNKQIAAVSRSVLTTLTSYANRVGISISKLGVHCQWNKFGQSVINGVPRFIDAPTRHWCNLPYSMTFVMGKQYPESVFDESVSDRRIDISQEYPLIWLQSERRTWRIRQIFTHLRLCLVSSYGLLWLNALLQYTTIKDNDVSYLYAMSWR